MKSTQPSPSSRLSSFVYAARGLHAAWRSEPNLRIHAVAAAAVVGAGLWYQLNAGEWALLFLAMGLVVVTELLNTALEALANKVSPAFDPQMGLVKDLAAGAVLVAAIAAVVIAVCVFWRHLHL